ncbi:hypothetical protein SAMN06298224_1168 [Fibrobacter sp. UWB16]|uniref:SIMPL domain-containing protein n=1 Tax=unclassified Fibrobacter TaxID=2634177 RepID=UPI000B521E23|nr:MULTISPECIES: SIMPL domain-containing protein [unclassified Fibrobacter]OWV18588.1 SIMPL domain-containing protein [Fibrobacter sp. UWB3]SOD13446.1 hypothetical protein SAMN06298224_1168 [Fibrobacter sp. UWB16]
MISKLLNIIYLVLLIVCVCVLIRVVKAEPAAVPVATSNGSVALEVPRIEVSATETKKFAADKFEMGFSLEIRGKDKESVSKRLAERRSVIFENVKSLEIPQSNVEQNSVEIHKEWSYRNSKRELVGYVATQSFVITVNRKIDAAALVQALSSEPDVEIQRTSAQLKDVDAVQSTVIKAAGKKATAKANDYAEGVGAKLGRVLQINSEGGGIIYNQYNRVYRAKGVMLAANAMMDGAAAPDETAIADSVEVSASVRVVYELK